MNASVIFALAMACLIFAALVKGIIDWRKGRTHVGVGRYLYRAVNPRAFVAIVALQIGALFLLTYATLQSGIWQ